MSLIKKIIVIPARYASTRFPGKMLAFIHSKTLIQHTFENAQKSKRIKDILIATDHKEIFNHVKGFGAKVVMTPKSSPNGTKRVFQALDKLKNVSKDSIVINIQGDEPTLDAKSIDKLCQLLENDPSIKMATLVTPIQDEEHIKNPSVVKCVFDKNFNALYFSRSPIPYPRHKAKTYQHLGVYAFRMSFLETYNQLPHTPLDKTEDLEQLKVLENGHSIRVLIISTPSIGVDTPEDIIKVEKHLCR